MDQLFFIIASDNQSSNSLHACLSNQFVRVSKRMLVPDKLKFPASAPSAAVQLTEMFLIVFEQQKSCMMMNELNQALDSQMLQ